MGSIKRDTQGEFGNLLAKGPARQADTSESCVVLGEQKGKVTQLARLPLIQCLKLLIRRATEFSKSFWSK